MNRYTPLTSTTPLVRHTPLTSGSGLARTSPVRQTRTRRVPNDARDRLTARSHGWCEAALPGCLGQAYQIHHRITQKAGGRKSEAARQAHDRLANLLHLCGICHDWITNAGTPAYDLGLSVKEGMDPAIQPVQLRYSDLPVYLDDSGRWFRFEEVGP